jgi:hypothetical protein
LAILLMLGTLWPAGMLYLSMYKRKKFLTAQQLPISPLILYASGTNHTANHRSPFQA